MGGAMAQDATRGAESIGDVLDRLKQADHGDDISVGDVLGALEDRSLGVIIAALGLLAALPVVGAIPGVSILIGLLVLIAVAQALRGRKGLWAPAFVRRRAMDDEDFDAAVERVRPYTDWVDRRLKPRVEALTRTEPARWTIIACAAVLAVSLVPLAVVPWGVQAPATGLVALGLALMTRDGAMALVGYGFAAATVAIAVLML